MSTAVEIKPNPGPQTRALASNADILIYGGAAGGGKSVQLLLEPVRHIDNPGYRSLILRRTSPMIREQGGLWDESHNFYQHLDGKANSSQLVWTFPSGAQVGFGNLQHEKNKLDYQGSQMAMIGFDELTHFTETQFWYLMSRNRTMCGVRPCIRATCNPEPGWVADLIRWWINPETGYPIPERDGVLRYFYRSGDDLHWYDSKREAMDSQPDLAAISEPKSLTFIASLLSDNPKLMESNPEYLANLMALPRIERERLLSGNWLVSEDSIFGSDWIKDFYTNESGRCDWFYGGREYRTTKFRRFAVIDTAGTGKQKADEKRGKPPSYTCCAVIDYEPSCDNYLIREIWRTRVNWNQLKSGLAEFLEKWEIRTLVIENAHFGPALFEELRKSYQCELVGPRIEGMDTGRGAKLERAVASGLLISAEHGKIRVPSDSSLWKQEFLSGVTSWTGLDDEIADWIDVMSYAVYYARQRANRIRIA